MKRAPVKVVASGCLAVLLCAAGVARAAIQFDVFFGFDGVVAEAGWFPVVFEVKNDGPSFTGTVVIEGTGNNRAESRRMTVELPTDTVKRFVIPVFVATRGYNSWDVRLRDERGKLRAERLSLRPRQTVTHGVPLVGAIPRTSAGTPAIQPILPTTPGLQPVVARMLPSIFPDNPIVLETMTCLYLNSERAAELTSAQVNALLAWLNAGGHLVVAVEQPSDISSLPWLRSAFPCDVRELRFLPQHPELQDWVRSTNWISESSSSAVPRPGKPKTGTPPPAATGMRPFAGLPIDPEFEAAPLQVATGSLRDGRIEIAAGDVPLVVTAMRGKGGITALLFSPEREPARSWKNLPVFWARLAEVPGGWYVSKDYDLRGGNSSDGIFGAMIDSRQVHKLPLGWLLLLLAGYLVVIGPLDRYWLKRAGKPMLTWITFPCYVAICSLAIYAIGYKLRAGEIEWNDLHLVDVLRHGDGAELRGRTYSSVYSPSNQRFLIQSRERCATFRCEFASLWGGGLVTDAADVAQEGDGYKALLFVPVWTSQLFVSDWWGSGAAPISATVRARNDGWIVTVENRTETDLEVVQVAIGGRIFKLDACAAGQSRSATFSNTGGMPLETYVAGYMPTFQNAANWRRKTFGHEGSGWIDDLSGASIAASFLSRAVEQNYGSGFVYPPGLDMGRLAGQGAAVVLAWAPNASPGQPVSRISVKRGNRNTLWRLAVPIE